MWEIKGLSIKNIGDIYLHSNVNDVLLNNPDNNFIVRKELKEKGLKFIKFAYKKDEIEVWSYIDNETEEILSISTSNADIEATIFEDKFIEYNENIFNKFKENKMNVREYVSCSKINNGEPVETKDSRVCSKCTLICGFRQKALETIVDFTDSILICTGDGAFIETDSTLIDKTIYNKYIK